MKYRVMASFVAALLLAATLDADAEITLVHAGQLLAVPGERPAREQTIVVDGKRIVEVVDGYADPASYGAGTAVVDLSDHFVLPGLMDMHVHLQGELGPKNEKETLKMSSQLMQMRSVHFAMETMRAGFTTVRDVGNSGQEMYALSDAIKEKAARVGADMAGNFARAYAAGVNIAYGTDSGVSKHGTNAEEELLMVEAGMSEMEVIVAATINAADLIDMSDSIGTLEAGKYADIIAVDQSPLEDIAALLDVDFVMKGGQVYVD
jgi:imidazolonepropionase-like amidohydrolase